MGMRAGTHSRTPERARPAFLAFLQVEVQIIVPRSLSSSVRPSLLKGTREQANVWIVSLRKDLLFLARKFPVALTACLSARPRDRSFYNGSSPSSYIVEPPGCTFLKNAILSCTSRDSDLVAPVSGSNIQPG